MSASHVPCAQCGLSVRVRAADVASAAASEAAPAFCCVGCGLAYRLTGRHLSEGRQDARGGDALLARVLLSAVLGMGVMVFSLATYGEFLPSAQSGAGPELGSDAAEALRGLYRLASLALATPILVLLGFPLGDAIARTRRWFSTETLVLVGTLAAFGVSVWKTFSGDGAVYFETATTVLVLYSLGRWLDVRARQRSSAALSSVVGGARPRVTRLEAGDPGAEREQLVAPEALQVGDRVRLRPGDAVPRDGRVARGKSFVDTSSLSGEELSRSKGPGERVLAGWTLVDGTLDVEVTAQEGRSVQDEVDRVLAAALREPPRLARIADRCAGLFLPFIVLLFAATVVVRTRSAGLEQGLFDGLCVILISCPCALGLATPLAFWAALGRAWRDGMLVRGGDVFERLARARRVFFDKTGTLTTGELELAGVRPGPGYTADEVLAIAARVELGSEHPIGRSLVCAARARGLTLAPAEGFRALPGIGVEGLVDGRRYALRRADEELPAPRAAGTGGRTCVVLWSEPEPEPEPEPDGSAAGRLRAGDSPAATYLASFELAGVARAGVSEMLRALEARGLELEILTGDGEAAARALGERLDVPVRAELLPADKLARLEQAGRAGSVFVGDGLNDAAVLGSADVGIAVAGAAPRSLSAADVQLLGAPLTALPGLFELARKAVWTARLNLAWSFSYNAVGLYLAATGRLTPIFAALAMVASSTFVVLLSSRLGASREPPAAGASPAQQVSPAWG